MTAELADLPRSWPQNASGVPTDKSLSSNATRFDDWRLHSLLMPAIESHRSHHEVFSTRRRSTNQPADREPKSFGLCFPVPFWQKPSRLVQGLALLAGVQPNTFLPSRAATQFLSVSVG